MCKTCTNRVAGLKKAKAGSNSSLIVSGLGVTGGFAASRIVGNIGFVAANPMLRVAAPLLGAMAVTRFVKGPMGNAIAAGMVAGSVTSAIQAYAPGMATKIGLGGVPFRSLDTPGVAGYRRIAPPMDKPVRVVMQ